MSDRPDHFGFPYPDRRTLLGTVVASAGPAGSAGAQTSSPASERRIVIEPLPNRGDEAIRLNGLIRAIEERGGGTIELLPGTYPCRSGPIIIDPTRTSIIGHGAVLDFSGARHTDTAILIQAHGRSAQYDHMSQRIVGLRLVGPGPNSQLDAFRFRTDVETKSSRVSMSNVQVSGFRTGLRFQHRSYLCRFQSVDILSCTTCVNFEARLEDAGENISFFGCTLSNSDTAIRNEGLAGFAFFGCSLTYVSTWYVGGGIADFVGCHFEKSRPQSSQPPFRLIGESTLRFYGGMMLVSGENFERVPTNEAVFEIEHKLGRVVIDAMTMWNVRGASGALGQGAGRIVTRDIPGIGNRFVDAVPIRDDRHDLLGGLGSFANEAALSCIELISDSGDGGANAAVARFGRAERVLVPWSETGFACRVTKSGGGRGSPLGVVVLAPVRDEGALVFEVVLVGTPASTGDAGRVWLLTGAHRLQPRLRHGLAPAQLETALGPVIERRVDAISSPQSIRIDSSYVDGSVATDNRIPRWATHVALRINLVELTDGSSITISGVRAFTT